MIAEAAITRYLGRELKDSAKAKKVSDARLARMVRKLAEQGFEFHTKPFRRQLIAFFQGVSRGSYLFFLYMSGGKTKLALDLIRYWKWRGESKRALVLVPNTTNLQGWEFQATQHAPELKCRAVYAPSKLSDELGADVVVCTYAGWQHLVCFSEGGKFWIDAEKAEELESLFDVVVLDESTQIKNASSLSFILAARLRSKVRYVYALTGTPFDTPLDLWSQFYAVDGGETLGANPDIFHAAFFTPVRAYRGSELVFLRKRADALYRMLRNRSIYFDKDECVGDVPPTMGGLTGDNGRYLVVPVRLSKEQARDYAEEANTLLSSEERGERKHSYSRLRQIASGSLRMLDDEGNAETLYYDENPKRTALVSLLSEIPKDESVVIAHYFRASGNLLEELLREMESSYVRVKGKGGGVRGANAVRRFMEDDGCRILLGSTSIAYGNNLQKASRMIIYDSPPSGIVRTQLERRIPRTGQGRITYIYDIVADGTAEPAILHSLRAGRNLNKAVFEGEATHSLLTSSVDDL